jgi:hypothetical protein
VIFAVGGEDVGVSVELSAGVSDGVAMVTDFLFDTGPGLLMPCRKRKDFWKGPCSASNIYRRKV